MEDILNETHRQFSERFKFSPNSQTDANIFILNPMKNTFSSDDNDFLSHDFDVDEIGKVIDSLKVRKSPGFDGIPAEFYKFFKEIFVLLFRRLLQNIERVGSLPKSMYFGVIS